MIQQTLSIIKPDAVQRDLCGEILKRIEAGGLKIKALKMLELSKRQARGFYAVHQDKPSFDSLTEFMSSGPIVVAVLEGENAIQTYRDIMGATNPAEAAPATIRKEFGLDIEKNSVHGSDSSENAATEINYFFHALDMVDR
ncbi:MAG: nucleoside-diphosphate kinase [Desulfohalobiaceae bacterium]|nr:nucleoside-diphosphate kinase [Desulfohalobiaceae bacterium]